MALWRTRPAANVLGWPSAADEDVRLGEARRCDSEMRRRSSRSWARREGASSGSDDADAVCGWDVVVDDEVDRAFWSGGRDDCASCISGL